MSEEFGVDRGDGYDHTLYVVALAGKVADGGSPHSMGVAIQTDRKTRKFLGEEGLSSTVGTLWTGSSEGHSSLRCYHCRALLQQ